MVDRDPFTRAFGNAMSDARRALIEEAWFGRPDPRHPGGHDRVLDEKLNPDKASEMGFLGWLQAEHGREQEPQKPEPDHGIDR